MLSLSSLAFTLASAQQPPKLRLGEVEDIVPTSYRVDLALDPAKEKFSGTIRIAADVKTPLATVWLNASQIIIRSAVVTSNGKTLTGAAIPGGDDFVGLKFESPLPPGAAEMQIDYTGAIRKGQDAGIFFEEDGGNRYLLTQFETTDARDAFPCFDEPSYKVPWQLTLHVPAGNEAISNTPVASQSKEGGTDTFVFGRTKPLPSYLVAFGVGPFEFVNAGVAGRNRVPVRIVTPKGRAAEAKYAAEVTATILSRLEDYFQIPYPYEKADQVAIIGGAGFAMENAGMVTYGSPIILAKPETDSIMRQRSYATAAAHELAHQWFGDLVTTAWWNDIWLNEAFATWMEQKLIAEWKPEWGTRAEDVAGMEFAKHEDSLAAGRKITQEIESKADIENAFDAITYRKGAAVIGSFENWLGPDVFRDGVRAYLRRFSFKTATTSDFLNSLDSVSHKDVAGPFSSFTNQTGIPVVTLALKCADGASPVLAVRQQRFELLGPTVSSNKTWSIPVCVRYGSGETSQKQCTLLSQESRDWTLDAKTCPAWVEGNAGAAGYYRVDYRGNLFSALTEGDLEHKLTAPERLDLMENENALSGAGLTHYSQTLQLAAELRSDPEPHVISSALAVVRTLGAGDLVEPRLLPNYRRFVLATFQARARELGWNPKPGEPDNRQLVRPDLLTLVATYGGDQELAREACALAEKWLDGDRSLSPNVAGAVLSTYAYYGDKAAALRFLKAYKGSHDPQEHRKIIGAMTAFRDPVAIEAALEALLSGEVRPDEGFWLLVRPQATKESRMPDFEFLKAHFPDLKPKIPVMAQGSLPWVGGAFCDAQSKAELKNFFEPHLNELSGARRTLDQVLATIDECVAMEKIQQPDVTAFLETK